MALEKLNEIFKAQHEEWSGKLNGLIDRLDDMRKIPEAQIYMLKYRHDVTEQISKYQVKFNKIQSDVVSKKRNRLDHYKTKTQITYNSYGEYDAVISADMVDLLAIQSALTTQIDYLKEVRSTIDKVGFSIKNRISLYNESGI